MGFYKLNTDQAFRKILSKKGTEEQDKSFRSQRIRTRILLSLLLLCFAFLIYRLFYLQCIRGDELRRRAAEQYRKEVLISARRGNIYDRNFQPLAAKVNSHSLYADPSSVENKELVAQSLSPILDMSSKEILRRLMSKGYFAWLKRQLSDQTAGKIESLGINGLGFVNEEKRFYPKGSLAAHVIGFAGLDGVGLDGIEKKYNSYLRGSSRKFVSYADRKGRDLLPREIGYDEMTFGYDVVLTIDEVIQSIAEDELRSACEQWQAQSGSVIVMNPGTGEILALANCPTYDLNNAFLTSEDCRRNRAIRDLYEPGSIFKIITAAAAINEDIVTVDEQIDCENGEYRLDGYTIHDLGSYGLLTFSRIVEKSSNIGTIKVAMRLGDRRLYDYIEAFGLTGKTGVDLAERAGFVRPLKRWTKRSMFAIPFGHEIALTPLHMLCSANAIANDGVMMKPFIVRSIVERDQAFGKILSKKKDAGYETEDIEIEAQDLSGKTDIILPDADSRSEVLGFKSIVDFSSQESRTPITSRTARTMSGIMTRAVEDGTGKNAEVPGYKVAGKTGTAQKAGKGGYIPGKYVSSFIGFLSAENITISMIVVINEPYGIHTGGAVACPVFREIAEQVMQYLTIGQRFYVEKS